MKIGVIKHLFFLFGRLVRAGPGILWGGWGGGGVSEAGRAGSALQYQP